MRIILLISLLISCAHSQAHHVVQLTKDNFKRPVEPSIAINPTNPDNIIGASIRYGDTDAGETRALNLRYHSLDGGKTWKIVEEINADRRPQGDDGVTFSADGIAYHSFIALRGLRTNKRKANGIWLTYSEKDTDKWHGPVKIVDHINTMRPFEDKPFPVVDNAPDSPHRGNVYISWTRFDGYDSKLASDSSQIYFSRSEDGGKTFDPPFRISDVGGDCLDSDYTVEGAVPAVGLNGEIYVAWSGPRGLIFDKSLDAGKTFGKDKVLTELVGGWDQEIAGISRCNGFPVTKTDLSGGDYRGTIYVNWTDERNGDPDVFVMYSRDGGKSWSKHIRVNDDPIFNGKAQFFTWMAVDPIDGSVNIVFYDRRNFDDTTTEIYLARSINGGETFQNHKISNVSPFQCNKDIFFGDYTGIDAYNGRIAAIFQTFISEKNTAISAAIFNFKPGTQKTN